MPAYRYLDSIIISSASGVRERLKAVCTGGRAMEKGSGTGGKESFGRYSSRSEWSSPYRVEAESEAEMDGRERKP